MEAIADSMKAEGKIDSKNVSFISQRAFWVIPGSEAPVCKSLDSGDDVDALAAIKIELK